MISRVGSGDGSYSTERCNSWHVWADPDGLTRTFSRAEVPLDTVLPHASKEAGVDANQFFGVRRTFLLRSWLDHSLVAPKRYVA